MHNPIRTAAQDLQHVLDHWEHLRDLLDTAEPGGTWPPGRASVEYLRALDVQDAAEVTAGHTLAEALAHALHHPQRLVTIRHHTGQLYYACAHCDHVGDGHTHPVRPDRAPEQLGEHPLPIRLHIADTCRAIELALCGLADAIAAQDATDPVTARWLANADPDIEHTRIADYTLYPATWAHTISQRRTAPDAARWLLARLHHLDDTPSPDSEHTRIARYAREAAGRIDRLLGLGRTTVVMHGMPCPWCGGELVMTVEAGTVTRVTCATGLIDCAAPVPFDVDLRARVWSRVEQLAALQKALEAAERKKAAQEQQVRRAEARRLQRAAAKARAVA
ncbi:hypothetical protein [Streptomyces sp. NPDC005953]|uniref:hypothetical protein n=1 Tax=Streptomyces sp. NPDC005953 TaxID=3156719 RepID=UPI0033C8B6BA